jgi:hypothetical protein
LHSLVKKPQGILGVNAVEVVGFGAFYGATHTTFHVKKHPTYMSLMGLDLLFSLKIHMNYIS